MNSSPASAFSLLVIGCGDLGGAVAARCAAAGWTVWGVRRNDFTVPGVRPIRADVTELSSLKPLAALAPTHVLIALSPGAFDDDTYRRVYVEGLRNSLAQLQRASLRRVLWVSSTSVYGQEDGAWVDENSAAQPTGFSGRRLLEAEALLRASGAPATAVRFGGIYGPGRTRLLRQLRAGKRSPAQPPRYSNRIHRDDAVGILEFLVQRDAAGAALHDLYLGVDTEPALIAEVERWFSDYLGLDYESMVEDGAEVRGGNRRCSSARLQQAGYRFLYPSYREGLPSLL